MSITQYNGSGIVVMTGKNCVAIASDMRYGIQQTTISDNLHRVQRLHPHLYVGLTGLVADMQTLASQFDYRLKLYELREHRKIEPKTFAALVSSMLYEKRFGPYFVEPLVCGLQKNEKTKELEPYICAMDLIGAPVITNDFLVGGTCSEQLYGCAEAMYKPDLEPEDLFETISQVLLASVDRDCLAGWGAKVYIITKDQTISRELKSRKD